MATLHALVEAPEPYQMKFPKLEQYDERLSTEEETNPHATFTAVFRTQAARDYAMNLSIQTNLNAMRTAIKLYMIKAETGTLPAELPSGLPGDPFSDKAFIYLKTEDGFVLRNHFPVLGKTKPREYAFKVK